SIGLIGGLTVITKNLSIISGGEDRIIAANLAAEGIELVRNVRDTNWLTTGNSWNDGIKGINNSNNTIQFFCAGSDNHDKIPSGPQTFNDCGEGCRVYIYEKTANPGAGTLCYSEDTGTQTGYDSAGKITTNFYRLITLDSDGSTNHIIVKVQIKWSEGGQNKYLTVEETLYNWK
ncbi:hypothetical protein KKD57_04335, partial [Patescibacteria group bacterium]|nr:hypothetical protein [Patescibacteria group bacterium]